MLAAALQAVPSLVQLQRTSAAPCPLLKRAAPSCLPAVLPRCFRHRRPCLPQRQPCRAMLSLPARPQVHALTQVQGGLAASRIIFLHVFLVGDGDLRPRDGKKKKVILGPSWGHVGPSSGHPKAIFGPLRPSWALLVPSWGYRGPSGGHFEATLGHDGAILGLSWAILGSLKRS